MSKILGIDYGQKRIGIAITDDAKSQVFIRPTIDARSRGETMGVIVKLCQQEQVEMIVLGWPVPLGGGKAVPVALEAFADTLKVQTGLPMVKFDERMTSGQADQWLHETPGTKPKGRRDQLSAMIILQNYLDSQKK